MPKNTFQEAGNDETYREDGNNAKNVEGESTHEMPTTHEKDVQKTAPLDALFPMMRVNSDSMSRQTHNRKTDVMIKTYQEEVNDEADTENVDVPGAVVNTSSGPADPQNNCVTGQAGTKDDTKMLAVHECTCHKGMKDEAYLTKEYRQMEYYMRVEGGGKCHIDKNPIERDRQTTHRKKTEMINKSHQGDVTGMFDEGPKGNQFKLIMRCDTATHRSGCQLTN
jgi:hypothetical protein